MDNKIIVKNLTIKYGDFKALENVSFKVQLPKFVTIMGPNGAGKTTLLKALIGLIKPSNGSISVLGYDPIKDGFKLRKIIGYVPQRERIETTIPVKVKSVVLMGLICKKSIPRIPSSKDIAAAKNALAKVELQDLWNKRFSELSAGQQQRVLIARALASNPKLLLLDEPLTAIDVKSQWEILETLKKLKDEHNIGVIMVTHDINPVVEYTDEVMLLNRKLIAHGKLQNVLTNEKLKEAYGPNVRVVVSGELCYAIIGDVHARHVS